ncbi:hypothetical protein SDRG_05814 [Saprolegnia diclina VS20]|uniref:Uncharacterized protein n=1 Tax=Saprolegnia diclina (strain VS20) TaxID=1156394 RepID=T0QQJ7_SAPDV|nr:hypothetical protein SDRG_05814 [Saprolegnia diclina VS20]EQC36996.1 hypothetical protein SDRG_05814 [Saprolegnia diclina VS20]|eukprot:XP_008609777.1 hypothetical protein SDRG_05814 [Saprolegnia diclina VS20]
MDAHVGKLNPAVHEVVLKSDDEKKGAATEDFQVGMRASISALKKDVAAQLQVKSQLSDYGAPMRILYLDPTNFPPAALDDATTLKLRRYILGSSTLVIGGCFFVEAFKLATEQERLDIAECANRHIIFDPSGDTVKVSAHPGDTVIVDGQYLGDGEKRDLFHCSRITLALTASLEISYDFYESPRAVTSPVESTGSNPNMVQAPAKPAPIEVATPTIAVPQERTSPLVPKIFATPAPKQAVPMAKDSSLPKTSTTLAFHDSRFPDPNTTLRRLLTSPRGVRFTFFNAGGVVFSSATSRVPEAALRPGF